MKRIDLFMPHHSRYNVLHHFTEQMYEALKKQGAKCRLLEADLKNPKPFIDSIMQDRPDYTFTFNGFPPDAEGRFLSDVLGIPHIYHLVDSASHFYYLVDNPRAIIACVDGGSVDYFQRHGFSNAFFLPHGTDASITSGDDSTRDHDVVFLGSCIDYEEIKKSWKKKFPKPVQKLMEEVVEQSLVDYLTAIDVIFEKTIDIDDPTDAIRDVEMVVRGIDRIKLLQSIQDVDVAVFGDGPWKKYLGKKKNINLHDPVPFTEAIALMKKSKIVLNSSTWIRYGAHERILTASACGALVITDENNYMREQFKEEKSIAYYRPGQWEKVNESIHTYLADEDKRRKISEHGRKIVMKHHTWDQRAAQLLKQL
jgi:spore maturation protein CgeB